jgi:hypothetical protein
MGYIFVDKESDGKMRNDMRRSMRGGYRHDGYVPMMHGGMGSYEHGYRVGYKHGWEDSEDDMDEEMNMRRARDSRGRYI